MEKGTGETKSAAAMQKKTGNNLLLAKKIENVMLSLPFNTVKALKEKNEKTSNL